jgi:2-hydroxy-6-oxonona-2,4-dienedioate hydrolase
MAAAARTGSLGSRWVRIGVRGGREMHYRVSLGPDPHTAPGGMPVVLIHGMVASLYLMPAAEYLAPHVRVYAPDLPGFGQSWQPETPLDVEDLAATVGDWLDALGLKRVHLVGNSLGCNTAVEVAIGRPDLVESVVLQGLTLAPQLRSPVKALPLWALNSWRETPRGPLMRQAGREVDTAALLKGGMSLIRHRLEERLPKVGCPALVIRGTRDAMFPATWAEEAVRLLPHGRLHEIPGGTHTLNIVRPLQLARAILSFIGADSGGRTDTNSRTRTHEGAPA